MKVTIEGCEIELTPEQIKVIEKSKKPSAEYLLKSILVQCTGKVHGLGIVWSIENQWIFQLDFKNKYLWCYYYKVWQVFEVEYDLNYQQIQYLQRKVVGEALNCKEFPIVGVVTKIQPEVGEALNCNK